MSYEGEAIPAILLFVSLAYCAVLDRTYLRHF